MRKRMRACGMTASQAVPIRFCSRRGLPCRACCQPRGALLPHPFTLTRAKRGRFAFCGTVPGVAPAGHYPAPCFRGARTFLHSKRALQPEGPQRARLKQRPPGQLTLSISSFRQTKSRPAVRSGRRASKSSGRIARFYGRPHRITAAVSSVKSLIAAGGAWRNQY